MRCYMITPGNGIDSLPLIDCPTPEPGPGQLLVALTAVSLKSRDLLLADGPYPGGRTGGGCPLSDGGGGGVRDALLPDYAGERHRQPHAHRLPDAGAGAWPVARRAQGGVAQLS